MYYLMEAFDQPWKQTLEGAAGAHWGIYDAEREPKFEFTSPIVPVPNWTSLAAASIGLSILLLALLLRDSRGLSAGGRGFLALVAYGITTFVVWLLYDFTQQYMSLGMLLVAGALLFSALGVVTVLLAEAHEWAEAVWRRQWRRQPLPRSGPDDRLPRVSIHVPAYNEPPEMLIASLDALARLDYPDFEVLVVDNNTRDPAVWRPVEDHCRRLGERFRFFHVAPLDGFKAGALNFALRQSDPAAEIIAVIDADYQVESRWLRELAPLFSDPEIAIVQAPQDYRDGDESLFKAMCQAEYRGFFHIGMVTRNERDAIIQHGTMTMVRRASLASVDGWSEWCITEDAELGLKIFERGHSAIYVPRSYGRGLMPDTFLDFKKQRFRWAYGAVLILRAHLAELLGLRRSALTPGQRYHFIAGWLPWLADGFNLVFNLAAVAWTTAMVVAPDRFAPPHPIFVALPMSLFAFSGPFSDRCRPPREPGGRSGRSGAVARDRPGHADRLCQPRHRLFPHPEEGRGAASGQGPDRCARRTAAPDGVVGRSGGRAVARRRRHARCAALGGDAAGTGRALCRGGTAFDRQCRTESARAPESPGAATGRPAEPLTG